MDAEEIESIMRQFKHGAADSEWKQFIKSIKITNIQASVCAYKNKNGQTFYPSKMFVSTRWDATAGYVKVAKLASEEVGAVTELTPESLQNLSYILGQY